MVSHSAVAKIKRIVARNRMNPRELQIFPVKHFASSAKYDGFGLSRVPIE